MNIISLFSGCGGMDLGFEQAGFNIVWANDSANSVWSTYETNHPNTIFSRKNIKNVDSNEIPTNIIGIVGGPPCQSWSVAGNGWGLEDLRGGLFDEFVRIISDKNPIFFVAENVEGMLSKRHEDELEIIKTNLANAGQGYELSVVMLNAADYGVPQNRKRVFFVGYRKDLGIKFRVPKKYTTRTNVLDAIDDLKSNPLPARKGNQTHADKCLFPNHEYWVGDYTYIFMSRNRVLDWQNQSYTIQASGRQTSIHPQAPKMVKVEKDVMKFEHGKKKLYRRLTIRECARLQTFPDSFIFHYTYLNAGYRMVGNAVPVNLAKAVGEQVHRDIVKFIKSQAEVKQFKDTKLSNHSPKTLRLSQV